MSASLERLIRHVNPALLAGCLRPAGEVDAVAEQAVAGHALADYTCYYLAGVDTHRDAL